jgi:DNA-binding IclR family transcriptional regulator
MVQAVDLNATIADLSRPALKALALNLGATVHLGVMEDQMVTYLVKQSAGGDPLFTREGMQLEAYCSGLGKVLLAYASVEERDAYLSEGPFIPLTAATKTAPDDLRDELDQVRGQGFAVDDGEVTDGLLCLAVPVFGWGGRVRAAISVSATDAEWARLPRDRARRALQSCAAKVERSLTWPLDQARVQARALGSGSRT